MLREQLPGCSSKKKAKVIVEENHYQLGDLIGQGTFGKVFEAVDLRNGQKVAIKQVYQDRRFKNRELQVISRLDNDNIIYMKDYYFVIKKQEKFLYIVMEFYGCSLQSLLKEHRKSKTMVDKKVSKIIAFQIFKALYYLQNNNICHRDLKPPNILINHQTYEVRICDFGSAKIFEKGERNVAYICSRYYRAPQLLFQYVFYQTQIDVWSAGCILVQLMTREPIFPGDSSLEQLIQILKVLGTPSKKYLEKYATEICQQLNLPKIPAAGWHKILKKYNPEPQFIDLIENILTYDIQKRMKPLQVLKHKYFHDLISIQYAQQTQKLPSLFQFTRLRTAKNAKQILELQQIYNYPGREPENGTNLEYKKTRSEYRLETSDSTPNAMFQLTSNTSFRKFNIASSINEKNEKRKC